MIGWMFKGTWAFKGIESPDRNSRMNERLSKGITIRVLKGVQR